MPHPFPGARLNTGRPLGAAVRAGLIPGPSIAFSSCRKAHIHRSGETRRPGLLSNMYIIHVAPVALAWIKYTRQKSAGRLACGHPGALLGRRVPRGLGGIVGSEVSLLYAFTSFISLNLHRSPVWELLLLPFYWMRKLRLRSQVAYPFSHRRKKQSSLSCTKLLHAGNPQPPPSSTPPLPPSLGPLEEPSVRTPWHFILSSADRMLKGRENETEFSSQVS